MATQMSTDTAMSLSSRVTFNTSWASTCVVGAPIQGSMRQLALDRWNYMYPS
jgi:hypothetical protein